MTATPTPDSAISAEGVIAEIVVQVEHQGKTFEWDLGSRNAKIILLALAAAGLKVVGREPTEKMLDAASDRVSDMRQCAREVALKHGWVGPASESEYEIHEAICRAMFDAAPPSPTKGS